MPKFLLHGLWLHESGLAIWAERVEGHRIITMDQVPAGTFPPIVHSLLDGQRFRHREEITLQTPKGRPVQLRAPMAVFAPDEAVQFLDNLASSAAASACSRGTARSGCRPRPPACP